MKVWELKATNETMWPLASTCFSVKHLTFFDSKTWTDRNLSWMANCQLKHIITDSYKSGKTYAIFFCNDASLTCMIWFIYRFVLKKGKYRTISCRGELTASQREKNAVNDDWITSTSVWSLVLKVYNRTKELISLLLANYTWQLYINLFSIVGLLFAAQNPFQKI
jgi:hypothetical protein